MNFNDLYKKLQAIEEGVEITNPKDVVTTKNADGTTSVKPKNPGGQVQAVITNKAQQNAMPKSSDEKDKPKNESDMDMGIDMEECGDDMSSNGGKITMSMQDLIQLVRSIDNKSEPEMEPDAHGDQEVPLMGGDMEEVYANGANGDAGPETFGMDAVIHGGADLNKGSKVSYKARVPGVNPMAEALSTRLYELYQEIKSRDVTLDEEHGIKQGRDPMSKRGMAANPDDHMRAMRAKAEREKLEKEEEKESKPKYD